LGNTGFDIGRREPHCPVLGAATDIDIAQATIIDEIPDLLHRNLQTDGNIPDRE